MTGPGIRCILVTTLLIAAMAGTAAAADDVRRHTFFLGFGAGPTNVRPANNQREVEGISFQFTTEERDLGAVGSVGYWITDHIGFELSYWNFGNVTVPFTFQDPHDNTSGTGESKISFTGGSASLLAGHDFGDVQVFGRLGAISWARDMDTRFDIAGQIPLRRDFGDTGVDVTFGAGIGWRFHGPWSVQIQFERGSFADDEIDLVAVGLQYDFRDVIQRISR